MRHWRKFPGFAAEADFRAFRAWRGESPRIALRNYPTHPMWGSYQSHPPLRYAPSPVAELDHWVEVVPEVVGPRGRLSSRRRFARRAMRPHILDVEHWSLLTPVNHGDWRGKDWRDVFFEWERVLAHLPHADERVRTDACKAVIMVSRGAVEQARQFLSPETWPKLEYVFPAWPAPRTANGSEREAFTLLTIGNRLSDEGAPEVLRAFEVLRARHGSGVRMILVSCGVPAGYRLPDGVELVDTPRMGPELKARVYHSADVLVMPSYWDSVTCNVEACAFGVPTITTRLHHGEDFVLDGVSGYLIDPPINAYSVAYGTRWKHHADFIAEMEGMRERGKFDVIVQDLVDRLETMLSGEVNVEAMRAAARRLHAERFSPEVRNDKLRAIYARALAA